jgi:hypothetical protein
MLEVNIASRYVYFIALSDDRIGALLPTLPPLKDTTSHLYREYLNGFQHAVLQDNAKDPDGYVGALTIYHTHGKYSFTAMTPMLESCWRKKQIALFPYCPQEGLLNEDVLGVTIPVYTKNPELDATAIVTSSSDSTIESIQAPEALNEDELLALYQTIQDDRVPNAEEHS